MIEPRCVTFGYRNCLLYSINDVTGDFYTILLEVPRNQKLSIFILLIEMKISFLSHNHFKKYFHQISLHMEWNSIEIQYKKINFWIFFLGERRYHITAFYVIASHFRYHICLICINACRRVV